MEGEKLGAVRWREDRGGGGPLKERESDEAGFLHPQFQLPAPSSLRFSSAPSSSKKGGRGGVKASASPNTPSETSPTPSDHKLSLI